FFTFQPPPRSTLSPYTTLFRSRTARRPGASAGGLAGRSLGTNRGTDGTGSGRPARDGPLLRLGRARRARLLPQPGDHRGTAQGRDRKSTRLNSSHVKISYAVFC